MATSLLATWLATFIVYYMKDVRYALHTMTSQEAPEI